MGIDTGEVALAPFDNNPAANKPNDSKNLRRRMERFELTFVVALCEA